MGTVELNFTGTSGLNYNRETNESYPDRSFLERAKNLAFEITGKFEGGKANSLQLKDSGYISYGKHQATLMSGTLYKLIDYYSNISKTSVSREISNYLPRLENKDKTLRDDSKFVDLLMQASSDPLMNTAQNKIFSENFWIPAAKLAKASGIKSELGYAIFYDTNIHGGLSPIIERTWAKFNSAPEEKEFLSKFLESRKEYLITTAASKRKKGDYISAKYLENAAKNRIGYLEKLLAAR
jgi:hypothetical protein